MLQHADTNVGDKNGCFTELALPSHSLPSNYNDLPTLEQLLSARPGLQSPRKPKERLVYTTPCKGTPTHTLSATKPTKSGVRPTLSKSTLGPSTMPRAVVGSPVKSAKANRRTTAYWRSVGMFVEDSEVERKAELEDDSEEESTPPREPLVPVRFELTQQTVHEPMPVRDDQTRVDEVDIPDKHPDPDFGLLNFEPQPVASPVVSSAPRSPFASPPGTPGVAEDVFFPSPAASNIVIADPKSPLGDRNRPIELLSSDSEHSDEDVPPSRPSTAAAPLFIAVSPDRKSNPPIPRKVAAQSFPRAGSLSSSDEDDDIPPPRRTPARPIFRVPSLECLDENEGMLYFEPCRSPIKRKPASSTYYGTPPRESPNKQHHALRSPGETDILDLTSSDDEFPMSPRKAPPASRTPKRRIPFSSATPRRTPARGKKLQQAQLAQLAQDTVSSLNKRVFGGRIPEDLKLVWSNRLNTTAGQAHWKRIRKDDGQDIHQCSIDLSTKVLDNEDRVLNTVAHELCHLAAWIIDGEIRPSHGRSFKTWGKKVMKLRSEIEVTTKHDYEIAYKYEWRCANPDCARTYGRHSKSIDPAQHACGLCRGKLVPMFQTCSPAKRNAFQDYLKTHMKDLKAREPGMSHAEVMKTLSKRFHEEKAGNAAIEETEEIDLAERMAGLGLDK